MFSDIVLPGRIDGLALAAELQSRYPRTPVLLTTGYAGRLISELPYPVLRKPYDLVKLDNAANQAIISIQHLADNGPTVRNEKDRHWFPTSLNSKAH